MNGAGTWKLPTTGTRTVMCRRAGRQQNTNTLFVGLVNDREYGGVFYSNDNGQHWMQKAAGLGGRDVFALKQTPDGTLVAGTNRGIFSLDRNGTQWHPMTCGYRRPKTVHPKGKKAVTTTTFTKSELEARVNDLELDSDAGWQPNAGIYSARRGQNLARRPRACAAGFVSVRAPTIRRRRDPL